MLSRHMTPTRAVTMLAVGQTIFWAGLYYIFPALLLWWEAAEAWPKTTLTAAFAGAVIVSALVSPVFGRQIDKGRGPEVMAGSALFGAVMIALLPLTDSVWTFAAVWLLIGAAMGGCLYEPCFAFLTRTRGPAARRAITLVTLFAGFAGTLSFPLGHTIADALGWPAASAVMAALVAGVGVPLTYAGARHLEVVCMRGQTAESRLGIATRAGVSRPLSSVFRHPAFWALGIGFSIIGFNHGVIINHLLPILRDGGVNAEVAVFAAAMIGPMQVAGRLAMMAAERHVTSHAITSACFIAMILATLSLFAAGASPMLIVAFVVLQGSGYGVSSIMRPVVLREFMGEQDFGTISGALAVPYLMAVALSPFIGSLLWALGGYNLALTVVTVLGTLGLAVYRLAARRVASHPPAAASHRQAP